ncbi:Hint domain-containing protein [Paenibacillus apiarius]|nr:Hint domain-containing protein [Paenibacillus apiarius]
MRRWLSLILVCVLLITSVPLASAQEAFALENSDIEKYPTVTSSVYAPQATFADFDPDELITVTSLTETFGVTRDWVQEELLKGYELHQIYQGLQAQRQGKDYEEFMNHTYPKPSPDPLIAHQEQVKSVSEAVYQASVTEQVYGKKERSVTDLVYGLRMFSGSEPYDEIALRNKPIRMDQAPYSVGSVNDHISTVDGSLRVEETDLVMPGPNGLDFALRRIYDSSLAKDDIYVDRWNGKNSTQETQEEQIFHLGKGWIWDISYIKKVNNNRYIYISGLGAYSLSENDRLLGYPFRDLDFSDTDKYLQTGDRASYELHNLKTGITQYFNHAGKLILIEDKYGNWIQFSYKYEPDVGEVLYRIQSSARDHRYTNAMYISYHRDHTISIEIGDRKVTYKKKRVSKIKNDVLSREQDILTEVIDPLGRSTKYDYGVWNWLNFNLVDSYKYLTGNDRNIFWGKNETIALGVIEHPTKAITEYGFDSVIYRKIGEYAEEQVIRYKARRNYYSSQQNTKKNELILRYNNGDVGQYFDQNFTFSVEVYDKFKTVIYTYDKQYTDYLSPSVVYNTRKAIADQQTNNSQVFTYRYDTARRNPNPIRIEETNYQGGASSATRVTTRTYDRNDWGFIESETNPLGATSRYEYAIVSLRKFGLMNSVLPIDRDKNLRSEYEYDEDRGGLMQAISKNNKGEIVQQLNYEYDYAGNPLKIRIKGDTSETVVYQQFSPDFKRFFLSGQIVGVKNVDGSNEVVESSMDYIPETGLPTKFTDGNGNSTSYTYDKLGRITAEINPDGTKTTIVYDDQANKMFITDPNGLRIEKHFDPLGNLIAETNGRGIAEHAYDENGRIIRKGNFNGSGFQYEYDAWDRVIKENFLHGMNRIVYDDAANTKTTIDGANNASRETYDIMNRVIKKEEIKPSGQAVVLARYEYDYAGNVKVAYDGNNNATKYEHDVLGHVIAVTDAEGKTTRYRYNMAGNVIEVKYADGNTVQKRYDDIGRLLEQTDPKKQSKRFYYDGNGNLIKSIDRKGQVQQYVYNNWNFLITSIAPDETISYSYDAAGNRTAMTDQTGTTNYAYYPSGELASITYPDQTRIGYDYEIRGLRTEQAVAVGGNRIVQQTGYHAVLPNPTSLSVLDGSGTQLSQFEYKYDGSYKRLAELKSAQGWNEAYTYDGFNLSGIQQTQNNAPSAQYTYQYDNNRNIVAKTDNGAAFQFSYDPLNRIKTSSQFNEAYTYDLRDNRSTLYSDHALDIKGATYTYDSRNRLTQVTTEDGKVVSYRYNGDNLMVERTEGGTTTRYYYDDRAKIVAEGKVEAIGSVTITAAHIHDLNGKLLARQVPGQNALQYYVSNGHGDITEIRDAQGNVLNRYTYDIWGNPLTQEEQVPNIFRYSGEYWDADTNLQYLRARWYDPSIGRFINEDTYEGDLGNPLSLNLYTYVANNPLKFIDPSGNRYIPSEMKLIIEAAMKINSTNDERYLKAHSLIGAQFEAVYNESDNNTFNYLFGLLTQTSSYSNSAGNADWARGQLIEAYNKWHQEISFAESLAMGAAALRVERGGAKGQARGCNCFTAGTKVQTDEGDKPIEDIEVGDMVLAKDDETGEMAYKEVEWLFQRDVEETYNITVGSEDITTTDEHPFWLVGKGWVEAQYLAVGDVLTTSDGKELAIAKIEVKKEHATVYNFKVKDFHTYFVSNLGIWTHNACLSVSGKKGWTLHHGSVDDFTKKNGYTIGSPKDTFDMKKSIVYNKNGKAIGEIHYGQPQYVGNNTKNAQTGNYFPDHFQKYKPGTTELMNEHIYFKY